MERNKSIDGLRTRADKNLEPSNIDGLRSRSTQPVFKTAKSTTKKPLVKSKPVVNTTVKQRKVKATLIPTEDEDLLAAFGSDTHDEAKAKLEEVSASFIEPAANIYSDETEDSEKTIDEILNNSDEAGEEDEPSLETEDTDMKVESKEEPKKEKEKKPKKKVSKVRRIITTIILVLVLGVIGTVVWVLVWGNDIIAKITGGRGNIFDAIGALVSGDTYEPLKADDNKRTNILAFGTSGWNMEGDEGNGVHDGAQLTDSIMAISINQETGDVAMISLPRDLKASPTCTATGKINEVYWCNNMKGDQEEVGAQALMKEVGGILGMDFQYFAHLNWGSLVSIVNTLDGIKVTLDEDISDYGWTGAVYKAGQEYTLNGEQALGLARARHGTTDGDFSRGNSQQKILVGIKDRIYEKNISLVDMLSLIGSLGDNLRTNLSVSEIKTAAHLTFEFDFNAIRQLPLMDHENNKYYMSYANINGISYVVPAAGVGNYNPIREYIKLNLNNDPVVREQARILILNGSDAVGVAATERDNLRSEEFNVVNIDNIEGDWPEAHYIFFSDKKYNGTVEALEKRYGAVATEHFPEGFDASSCDILVIIGGPREAVPEENAE